MPWTEFMGSSRDCLRTLSKHFPNNFWEPAAVHSMLSKYGNSKSRKKIIVNIKIRSKFNKTFPSPIWVDGEASWKSLKEFSRVEYESWISNKKKGRFAPFGLCDFGGSPLNLKMLFLRPDSSHKKFLGSLFTHFCHLIYMKSSFMNWVSALFSARHRNHSPSCFPSSHDIPPNFSTSFVKCHTETVQMCSSAFQDAKDR